MLSKERISSLENDLLVSTSALEDANANYSTKCEEFDVSSLPTVHAKTCEALLVHRAFQTSTVIGKYTYLL